MLTIFIRIYLYISMHSYIGIMIRSKKSLGQHFLRNRGALEKIVAAAELVPTDTVLEVGPGEGVLTALLLERAGRVVAVEKDSHLIPVLQKRFAKEIASGKLELIHCDILDLEKIEPFPYKIVANIPYYITSHFLKTVFTKWLQPKLIVLMIQKEVAQRIMAKPPHMNLLALSVQFYAEPKIVGYVSRGSFQPMPKVDSAIIKLTPKNNNRLLTIDNGHFFKVIRAGFSEKRKQLLNNLAKNFDTTKEKIKNIFSSAGIKEKARAENLSLQEWEKLAELLTN